MSRLILACLPLFVFGCGGGSAPKMALESPDAAPAQKADAGGQPGDRKDDPNASAAPAKRRIIYTAALDVVVENLDAARAEVDKLLAKNDAYVAKSEIRTDSGTRRTATYTLRVPVDQFRGMMDSLAALGVPDRQSVDSQDVTEEYVDVQARLKTMKAEEEVLNKLLKESGSRDDVLKTREQIRAIRSDIERAQSRLDYLSRLTSLSTINLTLKEIKDYKPPTAPGFGSQVRQRFSGSWDSLVEFLSGASLFLVGLAPWLPLLAGLGFAARFGVRRMRRASASESLHS